MTKLRDARLALADAGYDPDCALLELVKILHSSDPELRLAAAQTMLPYTHPKLKQVDVQVALNERTTAEIDRDLAALLADPRTLAELEPQLHRLLVPLDRPVSTPQLSEAPALLPSLVD